MNIVKPSSHAVRQNLIEPLDLFREDHARHMKICDALVERVEDFASGNEPAMLLSAMSFFRDELPRHIRDEEDSLFPLLERHEDYAPQIRKVIKQLRKEHEFDDDLVSFILSDLEVLARGHSLPNPTRLVINIRAFSEGLRRHSNWEEAVVLPLADQYLSREEKLELQSNMAARRIAPN
nr:hemerythrin domain-containing protein [Aestuariispira insulae]